MFEDVLAGDLVFGYVVASVVTFFLMFGTIFYQGRLAKRGEAAQFISALLVSILVGVAWPLATFILLVSIPFYVWDHSRGRRRA